MTTSTSLLINLEYHGDTKFINRELPVIEALAQKARAKHCYFELAAHHPLEDHILENGKYYAFGYVIFDHDSLKMWSVPNLLEVGKFIRDRVL